MAEVGWNDDLVNDCTDRGYGNRKEVYYGRKLRITRYETARLGKNYFHRQSTTRRSDESELVGTSLFYLYVERR